MKEFDRVKGLLYEEIQKIGEDGQLTMDALCVLDKLADTLKDLYNIEMFEENDINAFLEDFSRDNGYSGRSSVMRSYMDGNSYNNGGSYNGGNSYRSYRRDGGYSRDDGMKQDMVKKLEMLWNDARDEHDRNAIKKLIDQMK